MSFLFVCLVCESYGRHILLGVDVCCESGLLYQSVVEFVELDRKTQCMSQVCVCVCVLLFLVVSCRIVSHCLLS